MSRLYRNRGGYRGETIDVDAVLQGCVAAAGAHGWVCCEIPVEGRGPLPAFVREGNPVGEAPGGLRAYVSAGIHGDEPAGLVAVQRLLERDRWPQGVSLVVVPCLNPWGMRQNRRENPDGLDLNRDYRHLRSPEVRAHVDWLRRQAPFGVSFCLHEDWEAPGFYLYELNPRGLPSLAETILARVERVCPLDLSPVIEGRPASGGLIRPAVDPESRPEWPESFWLVHHGWTLLSYTLESPSDYPLGMRVEALVEGVTAALESWARRGGAECRTTAAAPPG
ncbi:M14 family metallopeptidase [Limisphaera sp. 4302-co]|uniref:M14 family metallopeptidase n=1 Tax=Limisphaera sp. 4302-co TaxID=3400417 RepID=UPI003C16C815